MNFFKRLVFDPGKRSLNFFLWIFLCCAVPLLALEQDLSAHVTEISAGLALRIVATGLLCRGQLPYVDFWDWTQPVVFEVLKYPYLFCTALQDKWIGFRPEYFLPQGIIVLLVLSIVLSLCLYAKGPLKSTEGPIKEILAQGTAACLLAFALTSLIMRFQFGELQYLLLLFLVPWLLLRWYRHCDIGVPLPLALFTGAGAGLLACFDIPFAGLFALLELALILHSTRWRTGRSPEWLAFVLVVAANLFFITHMEASVSRAFWQWTMPIKLLSYQVPDSGLFGPLSCPKRMDVVCSVAAAAMIAVTLARGNKLYTALTALMFGGFFIFLLEFDGFSQGLIVTVFAATSIALTVLLQTMSVIRAKIDAIKQIPIMAPLNQLIFFLTAVISTVGLLYSLNRDRDLLSAEIAKGFRNKEISIQIELDSVSKVGDKVNCISGVMETGYPYLLFSGRQPGGYMLWDKPLYLLNWLKQRGELTGAMKDFYNNIIASLQAEVQQSNAEIVLVRDRSLLNIYNADAFIELIRMHYDSAPRDAQYFSHQNHQPHEYLGLAQAIEVFIRKKAPPK